MIWDELKKIKTIDINDKITSLVFKLTDFLKTLYLTYSDIIQAFNVITNNESHKENITEIPNASIYRPERSCKAWKKTGTIQNDNPADAVHCTKLWLEKRSKDFFLGTDDYIKALGAFRYLYRQQVKQPLPLAGHYKTGLIPQTFFQKPKDKQAIDNFFAEKMKFFLNKREGAELTESHSVRKTLFKTL